MDLWDMAPWNFYVSYVIIGLKKKKKVSYHWDRSLSYTFKYCMATQQLCMLNLGQKAFKHGKKGSGM